MANPFMSEADKFRLAMMRGQVSPDYAQMNPYAMQNTDDKFAVQMQAGERMSPMQAPMAGTTPGMGAGQGGPTPSDLEMMSKDYTSERNAVDSQRDIAQAMRSGESPQGRTVGPYDVYVGPNWGDVVGDVTKKLGGGWLEGKANKRGEEIDEKVSKSVLAKATDEKRKYDEDFARKLAADAEVRRGNLAKEGLTQTQIDNSAAEALDAKAAKERADKIKLAQGYEEMVYIDDEGNVDETITDFAYPSEEGPLVWSQTGEKVDSKRWRKRNDPNKSITAIESPADDFASPGYNAATFDAINRLDGVNAQKGARMLADTVLELNKTIAAAEQGIEQGLNWSNGWIDLPAEKLGEWTNTDSARNMYKADNYEEGELVIRGLAANAVEAFRRARTGANLTGVEIKVGEDWDPTAPGIGPQESLRRSKELLRAVGQSLGGMGVPLPTNKPTGGKYTGFSSEEEG